VRGPDSGAAPRHDLGTGFRGFASLPRIGHHQDVSAPLAELSSLATALEELRQRVAVIADQAASDHDDDTASELFAVERALTGAGRRLGRITSAPRRRR